MALFGLRRVLWLLLGFSALCLGAIGAVLPLLPTTPFIIVAAFAFARSSDRWHAWLLGHSIFGPLIENWQAHGALSRRTKAVSTVSMIAVLSGSMAFGVSPLIILTQAVVLTLSAIFVLSRPVSPHG